MTLWGAGICVFVLWLRILRVRSNPSCLSCYEGWQHICNLTVCVFIIVIEKKKFETLCLISQKVHLLPAWYKVFSKCQSIAERKSQECYKVIICLIYRLKNMRLYLSNFLWMLEYAVYTHDNEQQYLFVYLSVITCQNKRMWILKHPQVCMYELIFRMYLLLKPKCWEPGLRQINSNHNFLIWKIQIASEPLWWLLIMFYFSAKVLFKKKLLYNLCTNWYESI